MAESLSSDKPPYGLLRSLIGICRAKSEIYFRGSIIIFIYFIKIIRGGRGFYPKKKKKKTMPLNEELSCVPAPLIE